MLAALLRQLRDRFQMTPDAEITTEANPDTVDERKLGALLQAGFARLSMGVQSFDPSVLRALERVHSADSARRAYAAARSVGYTNVNLDLIYGADGETLDSWRRTLEEAIELGPEHLSCYALTIEPATPLGRKVGEGLAPPPDSDLQAEMYFLACELLGRAGYRHYEVSNWAKPGFECVHNLGYWEGRPYLGLGAGAHSYRDGRRWWNVRPPSAYLEAVESGRLPVGGEEHLSAGDERLERVFLGLRVADGIPARSVDLQRVRPYLEEGLLTRTNGYLVLTERGMIVANEIVLALAQEPIS
jgi:oxygen-independent coproporphyrinogen-3 oxidase